MTGNSLIVTRGFVGDIAHIVTAGYSSGTAIPVTIDVAFKINRTVLGTSVINRTVSMASTINRTVSSTNEINRSVALRTNINRSIGVTEEI